MVTFEFVKYVADLGSFYGPEQWDQLLARAEKLCHPVGEDWNDGDPLARGVINRAIAFIKHIRDSGCLPPGRVYVEPCGNVCLEWMQPKAGISVELTESVADVMLFAFEQPSKFIEWDWTHEAMRDAVIASESVPADVLRGES